MAWLLYIYIKSTLSRGEVGVTKNLDKDCLSQKKPGGNRWSGIIDIITEAFVSMGEDGSKELRRTGNGLA